MVEVIPAVDLRSGRCVRLTRGRREEEKVYGDDPCEQARRWTREGAARLHVVDLDGAFAGRFVQREAVAAIARASGAPVQVGGGLRSLEDLEAAFAAGADRAILGTAAIENEGLLRRALDRWGERIAVAVDVRDGQLVCRGWEETAAEPLNDMLARLRHAGVRRVLCTDVTRDGALEGPNLILIAQVGRVFGGAVLGSGGFTTREDFERAGRLALLGLEGVVVGKALYEGKVSLREAGAAIASSAPAPRRAPGSGAGPLPPGPGGEG